MRENDIQSLSLTVLQKGKRPLPFLLVILPLLVVTLVGCASPSEEVEESFDGIELPSQESSYLDGELVVQTGLSMLEEDEERVARLLEWQAVNPSVGCLLTFKDLGIQEPVVCGVSDNREWLRKDVYGEYNVAGAVYLDTRCSVDASPIKMFHGHNMKDGTMFASLPSLFHLGSLDGLGDIIVTYPGGSARYRVFSVVSLNSKQETLPLSDLATAEEVGLVLEDLRDRSLVPGGEVTSLDSIVLNTCWYGKYGTERNLHCIVSASRVVGG